MENDIRLEAIKLSDFNETSYMGRVWVKVGCYLISVRSPIQYGRQVAILENDVRADSLFQRVKGIR